MISIEQWKERGRICRFKEFNIYYQVQEKDSQPLILLLHGFPTSSWDWSKMWPLLTDNFSLLALDFLGFGYSDKPYPYDYTIHEQADIVEHLLTKLSIDNCYIIAHDYAVSVMQELLARDLERVSSLYNKAILLNGGLFPETHQARPIQKLLLGPFGKFVNMFLSKKSLAQNLTEVFGPDTPPSSQEIDAFWDLINYNNGKRVFHRLIHYMKDRIEYRDRWLYALRKTQVPLKLVNGPLDPVSGIHMVNRYKELIPNPDIDILEGIGHYPNVESAEKVADIASAYFE